MRQLLSNTLVLFAVAALVAACGGGGGGGGTPDPEPEVDPPTISTQPEDQTVLAEDPASFSVVAAGEGVLSYQWQISSNGGGSWSGIAGATAGSYTTPATTGADDGNLYRCVVTNAGGSVTSAAASLAVTPRVPYRHTITIDGVNDFTVDEQFTPSDSGGFAFVTWDANYLYVAFDDPAVANARVDDWFVVYLGGAGGTPTGAAIGPQQPGLPFSGRYHVRWRADNSVFESLEFDGTSWVSTGWDLAGDIAVDGPFVEMRISLADLGDPSSIATHLCLVSDEVDVELTSAGVPNTSFVAEFDPDFTKYFEFDMTDWITPASYVPVP